MEGWRLVEEQSHDRVEIEAVDFKTIYVNNICGISIILLRNCAERVFWLQHHNEEKLQ